MSKIESGSDTIKELELTINFGIKTGYNQAFIIDSEERNSLINQDSNSKELIKPIVRGRDLSKYKFDFASLYMIITFPSLNISIDSYPIIKDHFLKFGRKRLEQTGSKGSRKKTNNSWFETQDSIAYWRDFEKPKIVWGEISDKPKFTYEDEGYFAEATTFIMTGSDLKYILGILNSKLSEWYFNLIGTTTGMGTNRWKKYKIELFPIKNVSESKKEELEILVNKVLEVKKSNPNADTEDIEDSIDRLVYYIYELGEDEIQIIENSIN
jgi:hypothetical protein